MNIILSLGNLYCMRNVGDVTDISLKFLTNLRYLNLCDNNIITNNSLKFLTNLRFLNLCDNRIVTDDGLKCLTNLESLDLTRNKNIEGKYLKYLTNLQNLVPNSAGKIVDGDLKYLTNLKKLHIDCRTRVGISKKKIFELLDRKTEVKLDNRIINKDYKYEPYEY
jgi:hypothetical protein